ncbi:hypothetical protein C943_04175 [Mariniradius saccharolyticus AK6]|uniref:Uncharacterized protein n=1 Tax=Mariniradius saccharolyticus AK6 TaxID=1239962 RepID=M7Y9L1_9BACT|nr:WYL domain-containing protein [Mariniradius saccharolyticus]EMS33856.1 hypothetical protein C943_04175 [Mariniradius saccharolyticus AK6]
MGKKNSPLIRYKILDQCFRNPGRKYFFEDLKEAIDSVLCEIDPEYGGISRRQLFDDIAFMESPEGWGIELEKPRENRKTYYRYVDTSFSIHQLPLNELEIKELEDAISVLSNFKGMPQFENLEEIIPKLRNGITQKGQAKVISFDSNPDLMGLDFLGQLIDATVNKKVLHIKYHPFTFEHPVSLEFHPYFLKQHNNRWFVFGLNPENQKPDWNLALDRILEISESKSKYVPNKAIDWEEYFEEIIGVTKPENQKLEMIVLRFYGVTGKYVASKPLHGTQKHKWLDAQTLEVRIEVIPNIELERLLLSYGENIEVISPSELRDRIAIRHKDAAKRYK